MTIDPKLITARVARVLKVLPKSIMRGSLEHAKLEMAEGMVDKGTECPCCGRWTKVDGKPINWSMARSLMWLVGVARDERRWVHIPTEAPRWLTRTNQLPTCARWGLVEARPTTDPKKKASGYWRPTTAGVNFVRHGGTIQRRAHTFNKQIVAHSGPYVTLAEVYGDGFDYQETMSTILGEVAPHDTEVE